MKKWLIIAFVCEVILMVPAVFAGTFTVTQTAGKTINCIGVIDTIPSSVKTYQPTMTQFKKSTAFYTDEAKKGNVVLIVNYNGATYQIIKR